MIEALVTLILLIILAAALSTEMVILWLIYKFDSIDNKRQP
jgi:hypothetical protein